MKLIWEDPETFLRISPHRFNDNVPHTRMVLVSWQGQVPWEVGIKGVVEMYKAALNNPNFNWQDFKRYIIAPYLFERGIWQPPH